MTEYSNNGTVMHLSLHDCTIINHGSIMYLGGKNNQINNKGKISHNMGGQVVITTPDSQLSQNEKVVYRDKVIYKDRIVYRHNPSDSEKIRVLEEKLEILNKRLKDSSDNAQIQNLTKMVVSLTNKNKEQEETIKQLKADLEADDRQKLHKKIECLEESLRRSQNRERTSRQQQYKRGYQAGVVDGSNRKKEVFDWGCRPTKEQAEALLSQFQIFLDCEE